CTVRQVNMTLSLAFLAPQLVKAAVEGRLPGVSISSDCGIPTPIGAGNSRISASTQAPSIFHQPFQESLSEEREINTDYNGCHRQEPRDWLTLDTGDLKPETQMRRRTFLAGSAAAVLARGPKGNAQQHMNAKDEFDFLVTQRVRAGKEKEVEAILRDMQAATLTNEKSCLRYEWYRASTPQTYILLE